MNRIFHPARFLGVAFLGLVAAAAGKPPNIVLIMADDLGWHEISLGGQRRYATPQLERMAAEGMRFEQFYAGAPVCAPSRNTLVTGQHTGHTTIRGNWSGPPGAGRRVPLAATDVTVAERLQAAGYRTALVGKWGLGEPESHAAPWRRGWDFFYGFVNQAHAHNPYPEFIYRHATPEPLTGNFGGRRGAYVHDRLTAEGLAFVDRMAGRTEPFFLWLSYTLPHAELAAPEEEIEQAVAAHPELAGARASAADRAFAAMMIRLDRDVGRILDHLERRGMAEETLVLFTADNGAHAEGGKTPAFFAVEGQWRGGKRSFYEGGLRVPLLAWWPGRVAPGGRTDHVAAFWDFPATVLDLAGVARPRDLPSEGISFASTLLAAESPQREHPFLYWETAIQGRVGQAVRAGRWKAVRPHPAAPLELYDLQRDPLERHDVAAVHPGVVERLREHLHEAHQPSPDFPLIESESAW